MIALLAVALPAWIVSHAPRIVAHRHMPMPVQRIVPQAEVPQVDPLKFVNVAPDEARAFNATVPFVAGPNPAARAFRLTGSADDQARATDCLAAAVLYEAGDDTVGQRAVAQVVLNRLRHPAFPKTICGVVFQGQERATGCQFTFTCDGALARHRWSDAAWARARETAALALNGAVYKPVGYATHYHTDWVVPYWSSSLDKVAEVHTHLFFRWTGWWGTPAAFNRRVSSAEPVIEQLAALSDAHKTGVALVDADAAIAEAAALGVALPPALTTDANTFLVTLDRKLSPDAFPALASRTCGTRDYCKFMAWRDKAKTPAGTPLQPAQIASMSFSYLRDRARLYDKPLWNCADYQRANPLQCMRRQIFTSIDGPPTSSIDPTIQPSRLIVQPTLTLPGQPTKTQPPKVMPDGLVGVRRQAMSAVPVPPRPQPAETPAPAIKRP